MHLSGLDNSSISQAFEMSPSLETGEFTVVNSLNNTNTHPTPPTATHQHHQHQHQHQRQHQHQHHQHLIQVRPAVSQWQRRDWEEEAVVRVCVEGGFFCFFYFSIVCVVKGYNGVNWCWPGSRRATCWRDCFQWDPGKPALPLNTAGAKKKKTQQVQNWFSLFSGSAAVHVFSSNICFCLELFFNFAKKSEKWTTLKSFSWPASAAGCNQILFCEHGDSRLRGWLLLLKYSGSPPDGHTSQRKNISEYLFAFLPHLSFPIQLSLNSWLIGNVPTFTLCK